MKIFSAIFLLLMFYSPAEAMVVFRGSGEGEPAACVGTAYYVSTTGSDAADGLTTGTPWQTITKVNGAAATLIPGDCVLFKRGDTWGSSLMPATQGLLIPDSGTAGNPIVFGAYGSGDKPVFDGTGVDLITNYGIIRGDSKSNITIQDIRVINSGIGDADSNTGIGFNAGGNIIIQRCEVYNTEDYGIKMNTSSNVSILYNDVSETSCNSWGEQITLLNVNGFEIAYNESHHDCSNTGDTGGGSGIDTKQGSENGTIHHNEVHDLTTPLANGIYVDGWNADTSNIQVYNNYVYNINSGGIAIGAEAGGALHNITIHHNIVKNALGGGLTMHDEGTTGDPVYNIYVYNNTLYANGTSGSDWLGGVRVFDSLLATNGVTFKNNIFSSAPYFQVGVEDEPGGPGIDAVVLDHNVIYGVHANSSVFIAVTGTNAITSDPLFTNAAGGDFTLQAGSPALNACDNTVWAGTVNVIDFNGVAITDGSGNIVAPGGTVNCGAFE